MAETGRNGKERDAIAHQRVELVEDSVVKYFFTTAADGKDYPASRSRAIASRGFPSFNALTAFANT